MRDCALSVLSSFEICSLRLPLVLLVEAEFSTHRNHGESIGKRKLQATLMRSLRNAEQPVGSDYSPLEDRF